MKHTAPEARILLACLSSRPVPEYVRAALADQRLNWDAMFQEANQLGVGPLLYYKLGVLGLRDHIPTDLARRRKEELFSSQARNMKLYADVKQVLTALTGAGIQVAVLKGLALAEGAYEHVGLRTMADVDLLVQRGDLEKAAAVVEGLGFQPCESYRDKQWYKEHHHHLVPYLSPDRSLTIEMHWHIIERTAFMDLPVSELWSHMTEVRVASVPCLALSAEYMLLHMVLHVSSPNRFVGQLRGFCDVAQLLKRSGGTLDWLEVIRICTLADSAKHLYCVLRLVRDVLGATVPDDVFVLLRRRICFMPFEEALIRRIALNASLTPPTQTERLYEWVLLDLVRQLLSQRPYGAMCRDLLKQGVARWNVRGGGSRSHVELPEVLS